MNPINLGFGEVLYPLQIALFIYAVHKYIYIFETNYTKPKVSKKVVFLYCLIIFIITILNEMFFPILHQPPMGLFVTILLISILSYIQLGVLRQSTIATIMISITNIVTGLLSYLFNTYVYSRLFTNMEYDPVAGTAMGVILFYIFALTIHRLKRTKEELPLPKFYWVVILQTIVFSITGLILLDIYFADTPILILLFIGLIIIVNQGMIFYQYERIYTMVKEKYERQIIEEQNKYYEQQLKTMETSLEEYKILRHDFRNKLSPLYDSAIRDGRNKEIIAMINKLTGIHEGNTLYCDSGNHVIDSTINFKLHSAQKRGIKIEVEVFIPKDLEVPLFDVTNILGNLLDNALEAVDKVGNFEKWLYVNAKYVKGHLLIEVTNSYDGIVKKHHGEQIVTRKKNEEEHGFGLKSIRSIAHKYDGEMQVSYDEKQFSNKVVLFI